MNNGTLIINNDNDMLNKWVNESNKNVKVITYGIENKNANFIAKNIKFEDLEI